MPKIQRSIAFQPTTQESVLTLRGALPVFADVDVLVGIPFVVIGSTFINASVKRGWIGGAWMQIPVISLALHCFATAQWLGGSGFIAAFANG